MSSTDEDVVNNLNLEAEKIRRSRLESAGLADQYDLWRESVPDQRMPDADVYKLFMDSQIAEKSALDGTLSVSTGGAVQTPDTEVPTPAPVDEGDPTEDAGDTSKGEGDGPTPTDVASPPQDPTALQRVEGMWVPPKEAAAQNHEPPSTHQMSQSKDWLENAQIVYDAMQPKGVPKSVHGGFLGAGSQDEIMGRDPKRLSGEKLGNWARNELSGFNWNTANTIQYAQKIMTSDDPKLALAFLNLINMYDYSDGGTKDFFGALGEIATDPTSYVGLGVGSVAAKGAALATAKAGLKKSIQMAIVGGSAGAVEGGTLAGGYDLTVQNIEQEAGARKEIDKSRVAMATGMGAGLGIALGGSVGGLAGRKMDKFAKFKALQEEADIARDKILGDAGGMESRQDDLRSYITQMADSDDPAKVELGADIASRVLDDDGNFIRLDDGSIDLEYLMKAAKDAHAESAERIRMAKLRDKYPPAPDEPASNRNTPEKEKAALEAAAAKAGDPDSADFYSGQSRAVVESMENSGYKVTLGEEGDILFDLEGLSKAKVDRIQEAADKAGVSVEGDAFPNKSGDQVDSSKYIVARGDNEAMAKLAEDLTGEVLPFPKRTTDRKDLDGSNEPFRPDIADEESQELVNKILEMQELERGDVVMRTAGRPGSRVTDEIGDTFEVVGRTKNGWYRMRDNLGREKSMRRKQFEVVEKAPAPRKAGPMELDPFSKSAAKIIHLNERVVSGKLEGNTATHAEQKAMAKELQDMGIDITARRLSDHWSPAELVLLRDTYNAQALGMADISRTLQSKLDNESRLLDSDLAYFNDAHSIFVATRDLFYGVSGNAARQLNILRTRPTKEVYDFSQGLMDSIAIQGGRANTERAIKLMAEFSRETGDDLMNVTRGITSMSDSIWGSPKAALLLNIRYNMMLSSWRTHAFNLIGNSASGVYQHLMVSPVRMGINNLAYAREVAWSIIAKDSKYGVKPDPADRMTRHQYYAELRGHYAGFRDSLFLAKEIALGRDIGEGKVWNELGLRYNVVNIPDSAFGKLGTTPVRALEAGDAFFKNQYFNSKVHEIASIKARYDEVYHGHNYDERYAKYLKEGPDSATTREATAFAAKQTYTNDPNVYGGFLAALAKGVSAAQNRSLIVNMIIPFVRTPANLMMYSMEMIGAQQVLTPSKTYNSITKGTQRESQEAVARLTVAAGLWLAVGEMYENGEISGTGPGNWEERKVWEAAGWQPNSIKVWGKWRSIERAAPAGQSLATIASVFDYYAMIKAQNKTGGEWIGAGLLYTADMIMDESYISSAVDIMTAISSKQESRFRSVGASMINSVFVPNLLRDLRRPDDETMRSSTSTNLLSQMHKQMMNATPGYLDVGQGHSSELAPQRDWKGDVKNYYGNAYHRALIPFDVRNPEDSDPASMALAYARIPVSIPDKTISWPGGLGDAIDLFAMDNRGGFVYDKYVEIMGQTRLYAVNEAMRNREWRISVERNDTGPNTTGDFMLRSALALASTAGRLKMLDWLIEHHGTNNTHTKPGPDGKPIIYEIQHQVSVAEYQRMRIAISRGEEIEPGPQYNMKEPQEGPEFFKP